MTAVLSARGLSKRYGKTTAVAWSTAVLALAALAFRHCDL